MSERALYCHPVDVVRKYNPQITESTLSSNDFIGNADRDQIRARIDAVGSDFEEETGTAHRLGVEGAKGAPETYDVQGIDGSHRSAPVRVSLKYRPVLPIDSDKDDVIEVRTSKDSWKDITDQAGDEFILDHRSGEMKIYRWLVDRIWWDAPDNRYVRASYRYGALGGSRHRGGQTTLDGAVNQGDTSISVTNASRLPESGVLLLGNSEYVRLTSVDRSTDTLTVTRGIRATSDSAHSAGDIVHYCPETIRDAVAAQTARELLRYEDWVDDLVDASNQDVGAAEKMSSWQDEWERTLAKHSDVRKL